MSDPSSNWQGRAKGLAFTFFAMAVALYFAARLIEAVFPVLIVLTIAGLVLSVALHTYRTRQSGW